MDQSSHEVVSDEWKSCASPHDVVQEVVSWDVVQTKELSSLFQLVRAHMVNAVELPFLLAHPLVVFHELVELGLEVRNLVEKSILFLSLSVQDVLDTLDKLERVEANHVGELRQQRNDFIIGVLLSFDKF